MGHISRSRFGIVILRLTAKHQPERRKSANEKNRPIPNRAKLGAAKREIRVFLTIDRPLLKYIYHVSDILMEEM